MTNDYAREDRFMALVMTAWDAATESMRQNYRNYNKGRAAGSTTWEEMYNWCLQQEDWLEYIMLARLGGPGRYG